MAARGVNKVILIGNLGGDPEVRYMPSGGAVTAFSLATSETWTDKNTGEKQVRTEWHRVVCFNKLGEIAGQYCRKGSKLYIEGSIRTRKWQDQQGIERYTTEIIATEMHFLDNKPTDATPSTWQSAPSKQATPAMAEPAGNMFEELDDDIPF